MKMNARIAVKNTLFMLHTVYTIEIGLGRHTLQFKAVDTTNIGLECSVLHVMQPKAAATVRNN